MKIKLLQGIHGARKAEGTAVVIDVFRASTTIIVALHQGAKQIIPAETVKEALLLKQNHPAWILVGERHGKKLNDFDYGNSPAQMMSLDLKERTIILSTSSGTKGIINTKKARNCIIASFPNISIIISYLSEKNPDQLSLLPMGLNASKPAIEDNTCADYIAASLKYQQLKYGKILSHIRKSSGFQRLHQLGQKQDISYCLQKDKFPLIPAYDKEKNRITKV